MPEIMKQSYKIPIPKRNKDSRIQDNYRGITIAPILGKILEMIALETGINEDLKTNDLQFGFSCGRSPSMATLLITEAIAEARHSKTSLYVASLDARKAFDVVNHTKLKKKLFN